MLVVAVSLVGSSATRLVARHSLRFSLLQRLHEVVEALFWERHLHLTRRRLVKLVVGFTTVFRLLRRGQVNQHLGRGAVVGPGPARGRPARVAAVAPAALANLPRGAAAARRATREIGDFVPE